MMLAHNHDVNPKAFMNFPQQRKVDENVSIIALRIYIYINYLIALLVF